MPGRPRVLVVDDHPSVLSALARLFAQDCDVVGLLAEGREAAAEALRLQPVVAVLDLNLPDITGLDICRQIMATNPRAKVIIISAMAVDDIREGAMEAGASGVFHKAEATNLMLAVKRMWTESA